MSARKPGAPLTRPRLRAGMNTPRERGSLRWDGALSLRAGVRSLSMQGQWRYTLPWVGSGAQIATLSVSYGLRYKLSRAHGMFWPGQRASPWSTATIPRT